MGVLLILVGVVLAALYAIWRAGAFPGSVSRVAEATSPALIGAMPVFALGFLAFGRTPVLGFVVLVAGIGVLAALVHGFLGFLVPAAARGLAPAPPTTGQDPRPILETFFTTAETFAFGRGAVTGDQPRSGVEAPAPGTSRAAG
jgi:hypothetical protein